MLFDSDNAFNARSAGSAVKRLKGLTKGSYASTGHPIEPDLIGVFFFAKVFAVLG